MPAQCLAAPLTPEKSMGRVEIGVKAPVAVSWLKPRHTEVSHEVQALEVLGGILDDDRRSTHDVITREQNIINAETQMIGCMARCVYREQFDRPDRDGFTIGHSDIRDELRAFSIAIDGNSEPRRKRVRKRGMVGVGMCRDDADGLETFKCSNDLHSVLVDDGTRVKHERFTFTLDDVRVCAWAGVQAGIRCENS